MECLLFTIPPCLRAGSGHCSWIFYLTFNYFSLLMMAHWDGDHLKWVVVTFFYSFRWVNIIQLGAVFEELIALIGKTSQDLILMKWMLVKVRKRRRKFSANQSIFGKILFRFWDRFDENDTVCSLITQYWNNIFIAFLKKVLFKLLVMPQ